jgi:uncharacterized membrane protein YqhA
MPKRVDREGLAPTPARAGAVERAFERVLWLSRLGVISAVVMSVVLGLGMFTVSTVDGTLLLKHFADYALVHPGSVEARLAIVSEVVEIVDGYLLGAILLIFALGLYELFISRIDAIEGSEVASRLLLVRSLDDLKTRLTSVIIIILAVKFFQQALKINYRSPLDLVQLAVAILLVAGAVLLGRLGQRGDPPPRTTP